MIGLPISKVVDKTMRRQQPHNAVINCIDSHPLLGKLQRGGKLSAIFGFFIIMAGIGD